MKVQEIAKKSVNKILTKDGFSSWLGIELLEIFSGRSKIKMKVRKEMLNGFNICHGGIPFSLADSAMAFASNSDGKISLSIENSISYISKIVEGDELYAIAEEVSSNNKFAVYHVKIIKADNSVVSLFKGTVYKTQKDLL